MKPNEKIFRAYDIRGVYSEDFDAAFARILGQSLGASFYGPIVVGRDERDSSEVLAHELIRGIREAGSDVLNIGTTTSPVFYFSVREAKARGGIMVTASHNSGEYNGFKVIDSEKGIIGGYALKSLTDTKRIVGGVKGSESPISFIKQYAEAIGNTACIKGGEYEVSIEAPAGVYRVLQAVPKIQLASGDLKACFDADADRIWFSEKGKTIPAESIFLLLIKYYGYGNVVHDLRFTRATGEFLRQWGVAGVESRVGRSFIYTAMRNSGADFGGELSNHFFFKSFGYYEAPELVLLLILRAMQETKKTLTDLTHGFSLYATTEFTVLLESPRDGENILQSIRKRFSDGDIKTLDGVTVEYPDWRFNVRLSHTEPLLRVTIEAKEEDLLDSKVEEVRLALDE